MEQSPYREGKELTPPTLVTINQIPVAIYGIPLTPLQRERLTKTGESLYLENMHLPDGRLVDGKVSFIIQDSEPHLKLIEKKPTLEIPNAIDGYELTKQEKENLLSGKTILIKLKNQPLFLQVDKDLNRVVLKTANELKIPKEIGGYLLTDADKEKFANREPMAPRVYLNPQTGNYFLSTIQPTEDGKGLQFTNYKPIEKEKAAEMISKFNGPDKAIENLTAITSSMETKKVTQLKTITEQKTEFFEKHVQERNFPAIKSMSDNGYSVSDKHLQNITEKFGYSKEEKSQLSGAVKISGKQQHQGIHI